MDNFDALLNSASLIAEEENISFEDALVSVLSDTFDNSYVENAETVQVAAADPEHVSVLTTDHINQITERLIPHDMTAVIPASAWTETGKPDYPFVCRIADATFLAQTRTDVCILPQSAEAASAMSLCPISDTQNGYVELRAQSAPTADLEAIFHITAVR